jgi:hypothetical protein
MPPQLAMVASSLPPSSDPLSRSSSPTVEHSEPHDKRARSPVEEDELGPHGRKRRYRTFSGPLFLWIDPSPSSHRKSPVTPWRDWGRTCARVVDAYTDPKTIINTYLKSIMPGASDMSEMSVSSRHILEALTHIN